MESGDWRWKDFVTHHRGGEHPKMIETPTWKKNIDTAILHIPVHISCMYLKIVYAKKHMTWSLCILTIYNKFKNSFKRNSKIANDPFAKKLKLEQLTIRSSALWCQHAVAGFVLLAPGFAESWSSLTNKSSVVCWVKSNENNEYKEDEMCQL